MPCSMIHDNVRYGHPYPVAPARCKTAVVDIRIAPQAARTAPLMRHTEQTRPAMACGPRRVMEAGRYR
jgi:hypothetical protein